MDIKDLIQRLKANDTDLVDIDIEEANFESEDAVNLASAIGTNVFLKKLRIWASNFTDKGAIAIAEALQLNTTLTSLSLEDSGITSAGAKALAKTLLKNETLIELNLSYNSEIAKEGVVALFEALKTNNTIKLLGINRANGGPEAAVVLAETLLTHHSFEYLYLSENNFGDAGVQLIAKALLKNKTALKGLSLEGNQIKDAGVIAIVETFINSKTLEVLILSKNMFRFGGALAIADLIATNKSIKELILSDNQGIGAEQLAVSLQENTTLELLDLEGCALGPLILWQIAYVLQVNFCLKSLNLANNEIGIFARNIVNKFYNNISLTELNLDTSVEIEKDIDRLVARNESLQKVVQQLPQAANRGNSTYLFRILNILKQAYPDIDARDSRQPTQLIDIYAVYLKEAKALNSTTTSKVEVSPKLSDSTFFGVRNTPSDTNNNSILAIDNGPS